jgi:DNA-3-methyladenine glycosylase II
MVAAGPRSARRILSSAVCRRGSGFRPVNWANAYEAAAWSLISARISMRQGQGQGGMSRELSPSVDVHGHRLHCFPGPQVLAHLKSFRGLIGRKVEYQNLLGEAALAGDFDTETLRAMPRDEALAA